MSGRRRLGPPPAAFVGRERALERLLEGLERVPVAVVYGIAGVGKSALAYAAAERRGGNVAGHKVVRGEPFAVSIDDLRRRIADGPVDQAGDDEERLDDLVERLERSGMLLVLDDVDALEQSDQDRLMGALGAALRDARVIVTSRTVLRRGPFDRAELRLENLALDQARELWSVLDRLYGERGGFEAAWDKTKGNPLLVRRLHAGDIETDDPIAAAVAALDADEKKIAAALALTNARLPVDVLSKLCPAGAGRAVVAGLVRRMVVDVDGASACSVHDLYRDALLAAMTDDDRVRLEEELAATLTDAPIDPVLRAREVCRHWIAAGKHGAAIEHLAVNGAELVRQGAAGELVRAFDSIPRAARTRSSEVERARALARILRCEDAHRELSNLGGPDAPPEELLMIGKVAVLVGDFALASRTLTQILDRPSVEPGLRVRALTAFALLRTHQGQGDEARALLAQAEREIADPVEAGALAAYQAFTLWLEQREDGADEPMARAQSRFREVPRAWRSAALATAGFAGVLARLGRLDEAEEALRFAELASATSEDLLSRAEMRIVRGTVNLERGDRVGGAAELASVEMACNKGGYLLAELWARAFRGRALCTMGQRKEGLRLLESVEALARSKAIVTLERFAARARDADPLAAIHALLSDRADTSTPARPQRAGVEASSASPDRAAHPAKKGEWVRARAFAALRAARDGSTAEASALADEAESRADGAGYGLDRAFIHLSRGILARLAGRRDEAERAFQTARREAVEDGADSELVTAALVSLGQVRIVGPSSRRLADAHVQVGGLVLDGRCDQLRLDGRVVELARHPAVRAIFYALAARPGELVSKPELAAQLWPSRYNPLVHDNAIRVDVRRLRQLLSETGISVDGGDGGYRLRAPEGFLYVEPL